MLGGQARLVLSEEIRLIKSYRDNAVEGEEKGTHTHLVEKDYGLDVGRLQMMVENNATLISANGSVLLDAANGRVTLVAGMSTANLCLVDVSSLEETIRLQAQKIVLEREKDGGKSIEVSKTRIALAFGTTKIELSEGKIELQAGSARMELSNDGVLVNGTKLNLSALGAANIAAPSQAVNAS